MLDLKIKKYAIFSDRVQTVRWRIEYLASCPASPLLTEYRDVQLSPRHLLLTAVPPVGGVLLEPLRHPVSVEEARAVLRGLLPALHALHNRQLVHGHLRLATLCAHQLSGAVFLTQHVLPVDLFVPSSDVGREVWRCTAPEIKRHSAFSYSADIWALGAIFLQLLAPEGVTYETEDLLEIDIISPHVSSLSASAVSFVVQCLQEDATNRPTIAELLVHPFLTDEDVFSDNTSTYEESSEKET